MSEPRLTGGTPRIGQVRGIDMVARHEPTALLILVGRSCPNWSRRRLGACEDLGRDCDGSRGTIPSSWTGPASSGAFDRPARGKSCSPRLSPHGSSGQNRRSRAEHGPDSTRSAFLKRSSRRQRRKHRGVREEFRMTGHADFGWRNACRPRRLNSEMAVAAIKSVKADVMRVAERDGLRDDELLSGNIGRARNGVTAGHAETQAQLQARAAQPAQRYLRRDGIAAPRSRSKFALPARMRINIGAEREQTQRGRRLFLMGWGGCLSFHASERYAITNSSGAVLVLMDI